MRTLFLLVLLCSTAATAAALLIAPPRHYHRTRDIRLRAASPPISSSLSYMDEAESALASGHLDVAERLLLEARAVDPNRDLPRQLHQAFLVLFRKRSQLASFEVGTSAWFGNFEAMAALHADAEEWEACLEVCEEAAAATHVLSVALRVSRVRAARAVCAWNEVDDQEECDRLSKISVGGVSLDDPSLEDYRKPPALSPFSSLALPLSPTACAAIGRARLSRATHAAQQALQTHGPLPALVEQSDTETQLTLGFVTPDANGAHPLGQLMAGAMREFRRHTIVLIFLCRDDGSAERREFEKGADVVLDVTGATPWEIAAKLRGQGVDVLIDLCGHAGTADVLEIFALRPAVVQINGAMGTPAPMGGGKAVNGSRIYDYTVCDKTTVPDEALRPHPVDPYLPNRWGFGGAYSEAPLRLPCTYFVCDHARASREVVWGVPPPSRAELGLPEDGIVLVCMNRPRKLDAATFDTWLRVLQRVEKGVLWIVAPKGNGSKLRQRLRDRAREVLGEDSLERRLVFADLAPRAEHLWRLRAADLALDTPAYNAHTLAVDYLWAGVPLVTAKAPLLDDLDGIGTLPPEAKFASRVAASIIGAALARTPELVSELVADEWTTTTSEKRPSSYEEAIVRCANDIDQVRTRACAALSRARDADDLAPLFNTGRWARSIEVAVETAHVTISKHGDSSLPPPSIDIQDDRTPSP